jgi:other hect domain ubiquitin protein ligase E3
MNKDLTESVPTSGVTVKFKEEFIFTKAFEQLKDINSTMMRPIKPGGTDPFIAFEINFK